MAQVVTSADVVVVMERGRRGPVRDGTGTGSAGQPRRAMAAMAPSYNTQTNDRTNK